jgi:hypothetical protein
MDSSKLITLGALGIGLYVLYNWLVSQCETPSSSFFGSSTCSMLGVSTLPTSVLTSQQGTGLPIPTTPVTTPLPTGPVTDTPSAAATVLASQLQTAAGTTANMTPDQWAYFYNALPGKTPIPSTVFEDMLATLGLDDASRGTPVPVNAFVSALNVSGLSGLGCYSPYAVNWVPFYGGMA